MSSVVYRNLVTHSGDLVKNLAKLTPNEDFYTIVNSLKKTTLSTSDALTVFNICYTHNYRDRQLFINYINPLENAFFGTLEKTDDNRDYRSLILSLPVQAKVKIILGDNESITTDNQTANFSICKKFRVTDRLIIDAERYEKAGLKKLKRVTTAKFTKPIIQQHVPGIRLAKSLASSIRESIGTLNINDLGHICKIFTVKHPLTGSLIEDTIHALVDAISKQEISALSQIITDISTLYLAAQDRYIELQLDGIDSVDYPPVVYPTYISELGKIIDNCTTHIKSQNNAIMISQEDSRKIATNLLCGGLKKFNIVTINFWLKNANVQISNYDKK